MKKLWLFILLFLGFFCKAEALQIVYPKTNPAKINAPSTFFIGSTNSNENLKINNIEVKPAQNGAFAQMVQLDFGVNNFTITSGCDIINFSIERSKPQSSCVTEKNLIEYPAVIFYVKKENSPLRMTPVNSGINRLAHLDKDTRLLINGEKGSFYRVFLNTKINGWISKEDVEQKECPIELINIKEIKTKEDKEFSYFEYELNGRVPFIIKEENGLKLNLFNVEGYDDNTYSFDIPVKKIIGYDAYFDKNKLVLKVRKTPEINIEYPLKDIKIVVDAGHGGCERGAIGGCGDPEKNINLEIAKNLKQELESRGAKVTMTRECDVQVSLQDRVKLARDKEAMLLISIHANALPDGQDPIKNRGTSVYYYHNQAKPLAESILKSMTEELKTNNDRARQGSLALVRPTSSVSVLIEVAYIINPEDYTMLLDKDFQINCAKAIADGIEKYLGDEFFSKF